MTKHEADVIGGLNMTDQISNEAYKQIMIAAQDENEVGNVLDKLRAEIEELTPTYHNPDWSITDLVPISEVLKLIDKYKTESEGKQWMIKPH